MKSVRLRCPAKVNLHLEVLGKRADGYHEVRTLLAAVGLFDELELSPAPPGCLELTVEGSPLVPVEGNTVLKAARLLANHARGQYGARICLRKRIPVAAGLGGGSSNAAATLVGLGKLWGLPVNWETLFPLAAAVGADVPFFLLGGLCWGVGRGDEIYPVPDLQGLWVVLIPGREPVSTASVYAALKPQPPRPFMRPAVYDWILHGGPLPASALVNDLQSAAIGLFPWLEETLQQVRRFSPLVAMVSGSGGTVFGLYPDPEQAQAVAASFREVGASAVPVLSRRESCLWDSESGGETLWKLPKCESI